jgi:hypothetical protein
MFFIVHRKGQSPVRRETSASASIETVLAGAKLRAKDFGADNIVIMNGRGRIAGVFSTYSSDID